MIDKSWPAASARRIAVPLLVSLVLTGVTACGSSGGGETEADIQTGNWGGVINPGGDPRAGGSLVVDQSEAPEYVSPLEYIERPTFAARGVIMQMFDQLVEYRAGSLEPQPGLAESWTISGDGLTYTFKLRDAEFSNGMPVTSRDVEFVLGRLRTSFFSILFGGITRVQTPDDSTVVIELSEPTPGFLDYLGFLGASIVPAQVVKSQGIDAFNERPIGSGPFVLERWKRDQSVELVRNDNYWRQDLPYLDRVTMNAVSNDNTRVLNFQSGKSDVADAIPFSQVEAVNGGDVGKVLIAPGSDMYVVWVNNSKEPLNETAVRQALCYSTPVDSIIDVVFHGLAPQMNTITPKLKYWTDQAQAYPYDLDKAQELLSQSTVPDGFLLTMVIDGEDQASAQTAQILKESWAKIGVDLRIEPADHATLNDRYETVGYETAMFRAGSFTSDVAVEDEYAELLFDSPETSNLFTASENPKARKLARQATSELDEDKRAELFAEMHIASMEDPPVIPLVYTPNRAAVASNVHHFEYLLARGYLFESVWVE